MDIKKILKRQTQYVAAHIGKHIWPWLDSQLVILMYHRVLPESDERYMDEQPGMVVHPKTFEMHLRVLKHYFEPVHLGEWLNAKLNSYPLPKRACAITFDDGWQDNYQYAFKYLLQEQVPATIFLVSDFIDTQKTFWPERLSKILRIATNGLNKQLWNEPEFQWLKKLNINYKFDNSPLTRSKIDNIITKAKSLSEFELNQLIREMEITLFGTEHSVHNDILTWAQIKEMHDSGLVDFGSHTCNHVRMSDNLDDVVMREEITKSKLIIESHIDIKSSLFCYPNGNISPKSDKIVRENYEAAVTTVPGWNNQKTDGYSLRRIGIHQDISYDKVSFLAKVAGFF